jgi:nitronate monooxygenase
MPILLAPMAGASAPELSIAVAQAGGMGACGVLMMTPAEILQWCQSVRARCSGPFQLNTWIPDPDPRREPLHEAEIARFLSRFGPMPDPAALNTRLPDFTEQVEAMLSCRPAAISSVMGLYPADVISRMRALGIPWMATVSTLAEAKAAEAAGADFIVAQGAEAGGHRASFIAANAQQQLVGLFALIPAIADSVSVPVIAAGGIADGRGVAAALSLGASAVQIGTGFLRTPEARIHPAWGDALGRAAPEDTTVSGVFSGRAGRSLATDYVKQATAPDAPDPAPYPVQRALTAPMRKEALERGDVHRMQAWAGQSARLTCAVPADRLAREIWQEALTLLAGRESS